MFRGVFCASILECCYSTQASAVAGQFSPGFNFSTKNFSGRKLVPGICQNQETGIWRGATIQRNAQGSTRILHLHPR